MASISDSGTVSAAPTRAWAISRAVTAGAIAWTLLAGASPVARLDVGIDGLRSTKGVIQLCLTADPKNFPACVDDARALTRTVPAGTRAIRLDGLGTGDYAIAVIHDENANNKLDTMMGIPREGFGFSRNPAIRFGPPKFTAARFTLGSGGAEEDIRMKYFL